MAGQVKSHFKLAMGAEIPSVGLGTWQSQPGDVRKAVAHAIKSGYRHIDCAWAYRNQEEVGQGIKDSGIDRKDLFVTSKLFEYHHHPENVELATRETLKELQLDYLDLYLMHWNVALKVPKAEGGKAPSAPLKKENGKPQVDVELSNNPITTWREMEKLVDLGLVKNIGVSNFNIHRLSELLKDAKIKPVANQVELSVGNPQPELVSYCHDHNILPQAYSPLGSTGASYRDNATIKKVAEAHGVDGANVIVSWLIMRGCNPLPKSVNPSRIENNLKTVELSVDEFKSIEEAARDHPPKRVCDQSEDFDYDIFEEKHPENNDKAQFAKYKKH